MVDILKYISGLDHAMIMVRDLDAAAETYRRLGFTLTPRGLHSSLGTQNHTMMFGSDYLELLAVRTPNELNASMRSQVEQREGLWYFVLKTTDARAAHAMFVARGIDPLGPTDFSRPVQIEGQTREASFCITRIPVEALPAAPMFLCQHLTPELVWRPAWQRHANGARCIMSISSVVEVPAETAAAYEAVFGVLPSSHEEDAIALRFGNCALELMTAKAFRNRYGDSALAPDATLPLMAAIVIGVEDVDMTRQVLAGEDVAFEDAGNALRVPLEAACGALFEFQTTAGAG